MCSSDLEDLMEVLEKNGVVWCGDEPPTSNTKWSENAEDTCYRVESKVLFYSEKQYADEDPDGEYGEHTRCTFYGIESSDFDVADENEILSLLGV